MRNVWKNNVSEKIKKKKWNKSEWRLSEFYFKIKFIITISLGSKKSLKIFLYVNLLIEFRRIFYHVSRHISPINRCLLSQRYLFIFFFKSCRALFTSLLAHVFRALIPHKQGQCFSLFISINANPYQKALR